MRQFIKSLIRHLSEKNVSLLQILIVMIVSMLLAAILTWLELTLFFKK